MFEPGFLVAPVNIKVWFPYVFTPGTKTKGTETGVFQGHVTGENIKIRPGNFLAVFLLNRPQQASCFIETDVIGPGVQRRKALLTAARATTSIDGTVGACAVPCHTNKKDDVASPVGWPPRL